MYLRELNELLSIEEVSELVDSYYNDVCSIVLKGC